METRRSPPPVRTNVTSLPAAAAELDLAVGRRRALVGLVGVEVEADALHVARVGGHRVRTLVDPRAGEVPGAGRGVQVVDQVQVAGVAVVRAGVHLDEARGRLADAQLEVGVQARDPRSGRRGLHLLVDDRAGGALVVVHELVVHRSDLALVRHEGRAQSERGQGRVHRELEAHRRHSFLALFLFNH